MASSGRVIKWLVLDRQAECQLKNKKKFQSPAYLVSRQIEIINISLSLIMNPLIKSLLTLPIVLIFSLFAPTSRANPDLELLATLRAQIAQAKKELVGADAQKIEEIQTIVFGSKSIAKTKLLRLGMNYSALSKIPALDLETAQRYATAMKLTLDRLAQISKENLHKADWGAAVANASDAWKIVQEYLLLYKANPTQSLLVEVFDELEILQDQLIEATSLIRESGVVEESRLSSLEQDRALLLADLKNLERIVVATEAILAPERLPSGSPAAAAAAAATDAEPPARQDTQDTVHDGLLEGLDSMVTVIAMVLLGGL